MKKCIAFILLLMVGFIGVAQNLKFDSIDDAIAFKPSFSLIDFSDKSLSFNNNTPTFKAFKYSQNIKKQLNGFNISVSSIETMRDGFLVFSPKHLKKSFFQDFNITYRRSELKRLLPRSLDPTYFNPCIGD